MNLTGYCNRMPTIDTPLETGGKDYVIVGKKDAFASSPKTLTIEGKGTQDVLEETYDYISRGWSLTDGDYDGTVALEDGTTTSVKINISTVC